MKKVDNRHVRFALGEFVVDPEVASLLSYAQVNQLVQRHARGDWGQVTVHRKELNEAFAHPKSRTQRATAQSVHVLGNAQICILTKQDRGKRQTHLFLL
mgnify:CR=1 FL=1